MCKEWANKDKTNEAEDTREASYKKLYVLAWRSVTEILKGIVWNEQIS